MDRFWKLTETSTQIGRYQFDDYLGRDLWFRSMTLLVSDDGNTVIAIDDYSEQDFKKNPEVLFFLHKGQKLKTYKLQELTDPRSLSVSVSHFRWFRLPQSTSIINSRLAIQSLEMNDLLFDAETGSLLKKEPNTALSDGAEFVYGSVRELGNHQFEIAVKCVISGNSLEGTRIKFESEEIGWTGGWFPESLVIRNGKLVARTNTIFNTCSGNPR